MTRIWKAALVWLLISAVVWLTTIWRWQSTAHDASTGDIIGHLFVLPLVLTAALFLVLWMVKRMRASAEPATPAPAASVAVAGTKPTDAGAAKPVDDARQWSAWVLAEAVNIATGADAASALDGVRGRAARPGLDPELQDIDGMPVTSVRVPELDEEGWAQAHGLADALATGELPRAAVRGLALLEAPLNACLSVMDQLTPAFVEGGDEHGEGGTQAAHLREAGPSQASMKAHLSGVAVPVPVATRLAREAMAPSLTVRLLMPLHWPDAVRDAALDNIRRQCGGLLDWARAVKAKGVHWQAAPLPQPESLWDELDQRIVQWGRQEGPELLLVLALDSALDEQQVERLQARGDLFTAIHQTGRIPGEGAAAVLLASPRWPGLDALETPPVRMWRPARARRDKSADASGRVGMSTLHKLLDNILALTGANREAMQVVSDADHRASRTAELFEALQEAAPGIDPMLSVTRVGEACGDIGVAATLVTPALASAQVRAGGEGASGGAVALVALVQSSHERVVLALSPWEQPPAAST